MKRECFGTITLTTKSALALWEHELLGQLSDGFWEDSRPFDHWKFWHSLKSKLGEKNEVITDCYSACKRSRYNFTSEEFFDYVGDRMLKLARMALVTDDKAIYDGYAFEYMPASLEEWREKNSTNDWLAHVKTAMSRVSDELARVFYASAYTEKDLIADLKRCKEAVNSIRR